MRRRTITTACAAATLSGALALPGLAQGTDGPRAGAAPAGVKLLRCSAGEQSAVFHARMRRVRGSDRMALRFTLLERRGERGFLPVRAPGLGRWHRSKPGVGAFAYRQEVLNLSVNALYRARVSFRWYAADGSVVKRARRRSATCRQLSALPNLRARLEGAYKTSVPGVLRYAVRLANRGRAPALQAAARLTVDGAVVDTQTVAALSPGASKVLVFRAPACARRVEAVADPDGAIAESDERDNAQTLACAELPPG